MIRSLQNMLPAAVDTEAGAVSLRILRALSRFESVDDLGEDVVAAVLMNEALRQRLRSEASAEIEIALVKDAIIVEVDEVQRALLLERTKREGLESALGTAASELRRVRGMLTDLRTAVRRSASGARKAEARAGIREGELATRVSKLEQALKEESDRLAVERRTHWQTRRRVFGMQAFGIVAAGVGLAWAGDWALASYGQRSAVNVVALYSSMVLLVLKIAAIVGVRDEAIRGASAFVLLRRVDTWLVRLVSAIGVGVLGNYAYALLRTH
jgi:hypothetical protein